MSVWEKLRGTVEPLFQLGKAGPQLKSNSGAIEARDATDAAFTITRGADPVAANDFVTKGWGQTNLSSTQGQAIVNFGTFPGSAQASVAVTGQTAILGTSLVEAWIDGNTATADHSADEHLIENIRIRAGTIIAGTGFTIYAEAVNPQPGQNNQPIRGKFLTPNHGNFLYGQFSVNWKWK